MPCHARPSSEDYRHPSNTFFTQLFKRLLSVMTQHRRVARQFLVHLIKDWGSRLRLKTYHTRKCRISSTMGDCESNVISKSNQMRSPVAPSANSRLLVCPRRLHSTIVGHRPLDWQNYLSPVSNESSSKFMHDDWILHLIANHYSSAD